MTNRYPPGDPLHPQMLKEMQRTLRDGFALPLTLRVHRALSWLIRADEPIGDDDVRFILLWIGFNAAYAGDVGEGLDNEGERGRIRAFFDTMVRLDARQRLYAILWQRFPHEVRMLLDNRYVFRPFWKYHNGEAGCEDWAVRLERANHAAHNALVQQDTPKLLSILFDRLYVLRNQLVHGGATWNSEVNREQVRDCTALLGCLLPVFIDLMMDHPQEEWPMPHYPVVD